MAYERVLVATGIGGQGVQFATRLIAEAAQAEGRTVQLFGSYGGMMRGGNTESTVVFGNGPITVPPVAPVASSALVMHHEHLDTIRSSFDENTIVYVNSSVVGSQYFDPDCRVIEVPALELATGLGSLVTASLILIGLIAASESLASLESLVTVLVDITPSYRTEHIDINLKALELGYRYEAA